MNAWLRHHGTSLASAFGALARAPVVGILNVLVIGAVLALPLAGGLVLDNLRQLSDRMLGEPQITVFLAMDATKADAERIGARLRDASGVARMRFVPRDEALADLKRNDALAEAIGTLKANPLPDAFVVSLAGRDPAAAQSLATGLRAEPKVAHVQHDAGWMDRLAGIVRFGRLALGLAGALLAVALVAVTFNTVRSAIAARQDEIEIQRLVGATDGTIRRPFAYLGAITAAAGGLLAWGAVAAGIVWLRPEVENLAGLYGSDFRLAPVAVWVGFGLTGLATALGLAGAWIAVSMHLHRSTT